VVAAVAAVGMAVDGASGEIQARVREVTLLFFYFFSAFVVSVFFLVFVTLLDLIVIRDRVQHLQQSGFGVGTCNVHR
jgi:hypothetical protein